jgi:peptide/nickel transport system permease protein
LTRASGLAAEEAHGVAESSYLADTPRLPLVRSARRNHLALDVPAATPRRRTFERFWHNPSAVPGLVLVLLVVSTAILADVIAPHDPNKQYAGMRFAPPGAEFPLGTDALGRDTLSRLVYGARPSVGSAALATILIACIGVTLGSIAGYIGGWTDDVIMRVVEVLLALPGLLLALALVGVLGPSLENVILGAVIVWWAGYARLVRALVLQIRERPYIQAAIAVGVQTPRIIVKHILPNILGPVIVLATLEMGTLILIIAGLNFLGLGVQPPTAEWGAMLNQGRPYFQLAPEQMLYPGLLITFTVLGFNLLGDGLRDVLDPRYSQ